MDPLTLLVLVLLILVLFGGGIGWSRRADYGPAPYSLAGLLLVVLLIVLLLRYL